MSLADQLRAEGWQEGWEKGKLMGKIQVGQEFLGLKVTPCAQLEKLSSTRLQSLLRRLESQVAKR